MYRKVATLLVIAWLAAAAAAQQKTAAAKPASKPAASAADPSLPSEDTVNAFMQQTFGYDPKVTWKVLEIKPSSMPGLTEVLVTVANPQGQQVNRLYVSSDGEHALVGEIIPFGAKPYAPAQAQLANALNGPSRGPANAPVTIVEFGDLQCPACKAAQPTIESLVAAEPNARFVFQNFPLEMHNWAAKGAAYADCVGRASNDAFWKFVAKTYETQSDITADNADEKLTALADGAGVKGADIAACAAKPDTKARIDASLALGKAVDVTATPTLFINGRKIGNIGQVPIDILKGLTEFAAKEGK